MNGVLGVLAAYALGSFPSAYLAGKLVKGVDLRTIGSGNLGATNVYREVGAVAAIVVLALDAAKGWVAAAAVPAWFSLAAATSTSAAAATGTAADGATAWWPVALGITAVLGHAKPVFLLGRGGGKGVATTAGVFLALSPLAVGIATAAFAIAVVLSQMVSVGSFAAAVALPVAVGALSGVRTPAFGASVLLATLVVWLHRGNLQRLVKGVEPRIGRPGAGR